MPGGDIQADFLEEGMSKLVLRTDGFENEGSKGGISGRESSGHLSTSPQGHPS